MNIIGLINTTIGRIHAVDLDEGLNAQVSYSLPSDVPFRIQNHTGEITTKMALDYETKNVLNIKHYIFSC